MADVHVRSLDRLGQDPAAFEGLSNDATEGGGAKEDEDRTELARTAAQG